MTQYALTGADMFIINDRPLNDFTDNTIINIDISNDIIGTSTGKNGNTVISENKAGTNATVTLRILMNSADDKFLNGLFIQQARDLPAFPHMNGYFAKRVGDGQGKVSNNAYTLTGGAFQRQPSAQDNVNGDTEQGTVEYTIFFAQASRAIT